MFYFPKFWNNQKCRCISPNQNSGLNFNPGLRQSTFEQSSPRLRPIDQGWIQQGFSGGVGGGWCWVSSQVFRYNSLGVGCGRAFKWIGFLTTWGPKAQAPQGVQGYDPRKILKIRTLEMPFPAIWALNYELQFDFKKGKTLEIVPYFWICFFAPPCPPVDQGQQGCACNRPLWFTTFLNSDLFCVISRH